MSSFITYSSTNNGKKVNSLTTIMVKRKKKGILQVIIYFLRVVAFDFGEINGKWELCSCSKKDFEFHFESLSDVVEQIMINNVGSQYFSLLIQPDVIAILLQQREHIIDTILTCLIMQTNLELGIILMNKNIDTEGIQRLDISEKGKLQEIERLSSLFDKNDDQRETSSFESLSRFFQKLRAVA